MYTTREICHSIQDNCQTTELVLPFLFYTAKIIQVIAIQKINYTACWYHCQYWPRWYFKSEIKMTPCWIAWDLSVFRRADSCNAFRAITLFRMTIQSQKRPNKTYSLLDECSMKLVHHIHDGVIDHTSNERWTVERSNRTYIWLANLTVNIAWIIRSKVDTSRGTLGSPSCVLYNKNLLSNAHIPYVSKVARNKQRWMPGGKQQLFSYKVRFVWVPIRFTKGGSNIQLDIYENSWSNVVHIYGPCKVFVHWSVLKNIDTTKCWKGVEECTKTCTYLRGPSTCICTPLQR